MPDNGKEAKPEKCPPLETPEYDTFIEKQALDAAHRALNGHPILRVLSTVAITLLLLCLGMWGVICLGDGDWIGAFCAALFIGTAIGWLGIAWKRKPGKS